MPKIQNPNSKISLEFGICLFGIYLFGIYPFIFIPHINSINNMQNAKAKGPEIQAIPQKKQVC
jgi:hypothetical protein